MANAHDLVLLDDHDNVKIIDYGFATVCVVLRFHATSINHSNLTKHQIIQPDNLLDTFCGSISYAAPGTSHPSKSRPLQFPNS